MEHNLTALLKSFNYGYCYHVTACNVQCFQIILITPFVYRIVQGSLELCLRWPFVRTGHWWHHDCWLLVNVLTDDCGILIIHWTSFPSWSLKLLKSWLILRWTASEKCLLVKLVSEVPVICTILLYSSKKVFPTVWENGTIKSLLYVYMYVCINMCVLNACTNFWRLRIQ